MITDEQLRQVVTNARRKAGLDRRKVEQIVNSQKMLRLPSSTRNLLTCTVCGRIVDERLWLDGLCASCIRARRERWEQQAQRERESGIDPRHEAFRTWADLDTAVVARNAEYHAAVGTTRAYLSNDWGSVFAMIGRRGTGKSQIAAVAVRMAIAAGRSARIIRTGDLLDDLKRRWTENGEEATDRAWMAEWSTPWLLVLDEFAERSESNWAQEQLTRLIDHRYGEKRKTILLANYEADEFIKLAGSSTIDRAREQGGILETNWPSLRPSVGTGKDT